MEPVVIRPAGAADIDDLADIEVAAGQLFLAVGMSEVAADVPDKVALARAQECGHVWVAAEADHAVGYVVASVVDGNAHVEQVSVRPTHGRRGIGRQLIDQVETWGRHRRLPATTLTTFRDVAWNGPYYRRIGFRELSRSEIGPELAAVMEHEALLPGLESSQRCAMVRPIAGSGNGPNR